MTDDDRNGFMGRMAALCEIHGKAATELLLDTYWASLRDLSMTDFARAVDRAIGECKYFPKPSELRDFAGRGDQQKMLNAAIAWEIVYRAMVKYDYTHSVDFGPLTNAVVRNMGGWIWLCGRTLNDLTFDRKKFEQLHQSMAGTPISAERSAPLSGQFGGKPVWFQIPGEPERRFALPEVETAGLSLVRDLANAKAMPTEKSLCKHHLYGEGDNDCSPSCPRFAAAPAWPPPREMSEKKAGE